MAGAAYRGRAGVRVRPMWPGFAVLALSLVALVTLLVPWNGGSMHERMPFFWMIEGAMVFAALLSRVALARQRGDQREIAAGSEGLAADGVVLAARASIRSAVALPAAGAPWRVRVVQRFGRPVVDVDTAGADDARALLEALGHGVSQHTVRFVAQRRSMLRAVGEQVLLTVAAMGATIAAIMRLHLHGSAVLLFLTLPVLAPVLRPLQNTLRVEVGADGFVVRPFLGRARFVRYADVRDVRDEGSKVVIAVRDADDVVLHFASYLVHAALGDPKKSFLARVREAREAHEGHRADAEAAALVARGSRSAKEWASALRALGDRATTRYRVAEVGDEALFRILEDPSADASSRGGAAAALRVRVDPEGKTRLRVAVESTAAPNVRSALARIVDADDDEAVAEALASIEPRA